MSQFRTKKALLSGIIGIFSVYLALNWGNMAQTSLRLSAYVRSMSQAVTQSIAQFRSEVSARFNTLSNNQSNNQSDAQSGNQSIDYTSNQLHDWLNGNQSNAQQTPFEDIRAMNISDLAQKSAFSSTLYASRPELPIATNQWFSSVAFTKTSEPLFAYPLAVKMTEQGFGVTLPRVVSTADTVFASYDPADLNIEFAHRDALDAYVDTYDDLSVNISQKQGGVDVAKTRLIHGSPFIFTTLQPNISFDIHADGMEVLEQTDSHLVFIVHGNTYALFYHNDEVQTVLVTDSAMKQSLRVSAQSKEAHISLAVLPQVGDWHESLQVFERYALNEIVSTSVEYSIDSDVIRKRYVLRTSNGEPTLFALPKKYYSTLESLNTSNVLIHTELIRDYAVQDAYRSIGGPLSLVRGNVFVATQKQQALPLHIDISKFSESEVAKVRAMVRKEALLMTITETDTYFSGKKLFAVANLLDLAEQLQMTQESNQLKQLLKTELETWKRNSLAVHDAQTTGKNTPKEKYFYYDPKIKGMVGVVSSFGSEVFNDHHFHYGYFIYAASILSRYDEAYLNDNEAFINLLVKDIANMNRNDNTFPYIRGFDAYTGRSNASGQSLFADGNNQESSSEAVNAWYALYLWSTVIHNDSLKQMSLALFSEESKTALHEYLSLDKEDARFQEFKHTFATLLWGGKIDTNTWFSPKPEAKLAIQILPISPASAYLGTDIESVRANLQSEKVFAYPTMFKDYIALYSAFIDAPRALQRVQNLRSSDIDGANTKSFMMAWIFSLAHTDTQIQGAQSHNVSQ